MVADPKVFDPATGDFETVEFTLSNRSEWTALTNPYDWSVYRFDDDARVGVTGTDGGTNLSETATGWDSYGRL